MQLLPCRDLSAPAARRHAFFQQMMSEDGRKTRAVTRIQGLEHLLMIVDRAIPFGSQKVRPKPERLQSTIH